MAIKLNSTLLTLSLLSACDLDVQDQRIDARDDHENIADGSEEIRNGAAVPFGTHPAVGVIFRHVSADNYAIHCTGTLIAPDVVVTAAHCLIDADNRIYPNSRLVFSLSFSGPKVGVTRNGVVTRDILRLDPQSYVRAQEIVPHLAYTTSRAPNDVGLIQLATPVSGIAFPTLANDTTPTPSNITIVGFGINETNNANGSKRVGTARVNVYQKNQPLFQVVPDGSGAKTCLGDSGGPALFGNTLLGITHGGDGNANYDCNTGTYSSYTTAAYYRAFVEEKRATLSKFFANPRMNLDVNNDGAVSQLDALILINLLNKVSPPPWFDTATHALRPNLASKTSASFAYADPSGDGYLTSLDLLLVVNHLNATGGGVYYPPPGEGEGETCMHSPCSTGAALNWTCDSCAASVCAVDSYCCNYGWDSICKSEVASICHQTCS